MGSDIITEERDNGFTAGGIEFRVHMPGDPELVTDERQVVVLKPTFFLRKYDRVFRSLPVRNVLEFGIAQGGSIIYFALAHPELRFVGIDLRPPIEAVVRRVEQLGLADRVKLYYGTDQADAARIHEIIQENFGDEPLGAVTEDASHFYGPSKKTFECTFGRLAPGGMYCLEDWQWAHEPGPCQSTQWMDEPSLANLLFEIILMPPAGDRLVAGVQIDAGSAFIERGTAPRVTGFSIDGVILTRGRRLSLI